MVHYIHLDSRAMTPNDVRNKQILVRYEHVSLALCRGWLHCCCRFTNPYYSKVAVGHGTRRPGLTTEHAQEVNH